MRKQRGSMLVFTIFSTSFLMVLLVLLTNHVFSPILRHHTAQGAVEVAALSAASQLNRIVVKDDNWGYLSLSDRPAYGDHIVAGDREPLPVIGINTAIKSVRLEHLVAKRLESDEIKAAGDADYLKLRESAHRLQDELISGVSAKSCHAFDAEGKRVRVYENALEMFKNNMPELRDGTAKLKDFRIRLGWLDKEAASLKVDDIEYFMADVAPDTRLANPKQFRDALGKRFGAALMVEADIEYPQAVKTETERRKGYIQTVRAAALPAAMADYSNSGAFVVSLPQGSLCGINSLRDLLLDAKFRRATSEVQFSRDGDFPQDPRAHLVPEQCEEKTQVSKFTARAFADWIRNMHGKADLDSIMAVLDQPFTNNPASSDSVIAIYDLPRGGKCRVRRFVDGTFQLHTVADGQKYFFANRVCESEKGTIGIAIRDQVADLNADCGKHAGQPLPNEMPVDFRMESVNREPLPVVAEGTHVRPSYLEGGLAVALELFVTN